MFWRALLFRLISLIGFVTLISSCYLSDKQIENQTVFDLNIPSSPHSFDPFTQKGSNSKYILNNLYTTLYKWDKNNKLVPAAAEMCDWFSYKNLHRLLLQNKNKLSNLIDKKKYYLVCNIKNNIFFENIKPIEAKNFIYSFNILKNDTFSENTDFKKINILEINTKTLLFESETKLKSLIHYLTDLETAPRFEEKIYTNAKDVVSSTNYKIEKFKPNQYLILNNLLTKIKVKYHFIEDQSTALRLFKAKSLDLLTHVAVRDVLSEIGSEKIIQINMFRMDGLFFSPSSFDLELRKALFHSLDFKYLKEIYKSKEMPGCPSLPKTLYNQNLCYEFNLNKAMLAYKKSNFQNKKFKITYSTFGGDDIQKGMEWIENQWKKNIGLDVELEPLESGLYFQRIKSKTFQVARRGIPLNIPNCLEALSYFKSDHHLNYSGLESKNFDSILEKLESDLDNKIICDEGLKFLYDNYIYLPLGEIHFNFIDQGVFTDWSVNGLNSLDLSNLKLNKSF